MGRLWAGLVSGVWVLVLFVALFGVVLNVPVVRAGGTIYIRADGSIDPPTAPISTSDNVTYTFTDNVYDSIVVERGNITIDGNGYMLQGSGSGNGFYLSGINNVTIKGTNIKGFYQGVRLFVSSYNTICANNITTNESYGIALYESSNNTIFGNNLTTNGRESYAYVGGVLLWYSSSNSIFENNVTANKWAGIQLYESSNNSIFKNNLTTNEQYGIYSEYSSNNSIVGNSLASNWCGLWLRDNTGNRFYHNNFVDNIFQVYVVTPGDANFWDDGYPSGGNYWSDYIGVDLFSGPNQDEEGSDGIGDVAIHGDRYPFMGHITAFEAATLKRVKYYIHTVSNSTVSEFNFNRDEKLVSFNVTGTSSTLGFCRVTIPHILLGGPYTVWVGNTQVTPSIWSTSTHSFLYFIYNHSTQNAQIIGTVTPKFPVANFTYSPEYPFVGDTVTFDASTSYDPDDTIKSYMWDFGDGNVTIISTPIIMHVFSMLGTHTVSLTVTDNDGLTETISKSVTIMFCIIYIRPDGSVDPLTEFIERIGDVYSFTSDFFASIVVQKDNIIIDGAGQTLQGAAQYSAPGIDLSYRSNVTVKNAKIQRFGIGINLKDSANCTIEKNEISGNSESGIMVGKGNVVIRENTIKENKNGIAAESSDTHSDIAIVRNAILSNQENGIYLYSYDHNGYSYIYNVVITSNNCSSNNDNGIHLSSDGYAVGSIYNVTISSNTVLSNQGNGIYISSTTTQHSYIYDMTFTSNNVSFNKNYGIYLYSRGGYQTSNLYNVIFSSNTVSSNQENGIYLYSSWGYYSMTHGHIYDVTFISNNVSSNSGDGIVLYSHEGGTGGGSIYNVTIWSNIISLNSGDGIQLYNHGEPEPYNYICNVTLSSNTVSSNSGHGVTFDALVQVYDVNVYHNNFINNTSQAYISESYSIAWDDGYPSGGNYWSNYIGVDLKNGPNQDQPGSDGIGDVPYVINAKNRDRYPLMYQWPDITSPSTIDDYDGLWHTTDFTINLTATDDISGVAETHYRINDGPIQNVSAHGHPLITTEGADNKLEYWSVDYACNEELPHKILTGIKLDKTYPTIETPSRMPDGDVLPDQAVKVSVNVTDATSQVKNVTLYYTINDGETWTDLPMNHTALNLYETTIPPQQAGTTVRFRIVAYDHAGNNRTLDGAEPYCVYQVVPEFPPSLFLPLFMIITLMAVIAYKRKHPPL